MPMFYTPKPRQFHYKPRFYDPEREDWENLKKKYNLDDPTTAEEAKQSTVANTENTGLQSDAETNNAGNSDLEYFQRRLREIDRQERQKKEKMSVADLFRKRERPQFHYVSRFDENGNLIEKPAATKESTVKHRITRRFDEDEMDRLKPVPAGKLMVYTLLVCVLLYLVFA